MHHQHVVVDVRVLSPVSLKCVQESAHTIVDVGTGLSAVRKAIVEGSKLVSVLLTLQCLVWILEVAEVLFADPAKGNASQSQI